MGDPRLRLGGAVSNVQGSLATVEAALGELRQAVPISVTAVPQAAAATNEAASVPRPSLPRPSVRYLKFKDFRALLSIERNPTVGGAIRSGLFRSTLVLLVGAAAITGLVDAAASREYPKQTAYVKDLLKRCLHEGINILRKNAGPVCEEFKAEAADLADKMIRDRDRMAELRSKLGDQRALEEFHKEKLRGDVGEKAWEEKHRKIPLAPSAPPSRAAPPPPPKKADTAPLAPKPVPTAKIIRAAPLQPPSLAGTKRPMDQNDETQMKACANLMATQRGKNFPFRFPDPDKKLEQLAREIDCDPFIAQVDKIAKEEFAKREQRIRAPSPPP